MKIKLDENLPHRLVRFLTALGDESDTVVDERLAGRDDEVLWQVAQADGRFLVTQDRISPTSEYLPGTHIGLLLVRLRSRSEALYERLSTVFGTEDVQSWKGCIVSVTDHKVRVKRPAAG